MEADESCFFQSFKLSQHFEETPHSSRNQEISHGQLLFKKFRGGISFGAGLEFFQVLEQAQGGQEPVLFCVAGSVQSQGFPLSNQRAEVHVSGDVLVSEALVGIRGSRMPEITEQGAMPTAGVIKLFRLVPIIDGQNKSAVQAPAYPFDPFQGLQIDFPPLSFLERSAKVPEICLERRGRRGGKNSGKRMVPVDDVNFPELSPLLLDEMDGERIDQFIGKEASRNGLLPAEEDPRTNPFGLSLG